MGREEGPTPIPDRRRDIGCGMDRQATEDATDTANVPEGGGGRGFAHPVHQHHQRSPAFSRHGLRVVHHIDADGGGCRCRRRLSTRRCSDV